MVLKALLVGVNYLSQGDSALKSPINNIELFKDFLISYCHLDEENITLLSDSSEHKNATFFSITNEIKTLFKNSNKNDFIILYFSGYGNFLDTLSEESELFYNESLKRNTLYKGFNKDTLFLPQDYHISTLTNDYFNNLLSHSNSRVFLFFDCLNMYNNFKLKHNYNVNNNIYYEYLDNKKSSFDIIHLSFNYNEQKIFEKFYKVDLITNKINKYNSKFLILLLLNLKEYLNLNLNFSAFSYNHFFNNLQKILNKHNLDFSSIANEKVDNVKMNKCFSCGDDNIDLLLSFSDNNIKNDMFFTSKKIVEKNDDNTEELVAKKLKYRDKTLAYHIVEQERNYKILKKKHDVIIKKYLNLQRKVNPNTSFARLI